MSLPGNGNHLTDTGHVSSTANGCFKEAADLAATLDQFTKAIELYERVASASLNSALTRYSVREYYLKAGLCWLATGVRLYPPILIRSAY